MLWMAILLQKWTTHSSATNYSFPEGRKPSGKDRSKAKAGRKANLRRMRGRK